MFHPLAARRNPLVIKKPNAVWLLGAQPSANTAPGGVCEQTLQKHKVSASGRPRNTVNQKVSGLRETAKNVKHTAGVRGFTRMAASAESIIIHKNNVNHGMLETTCLTKPFKTSHQATFVRLRAPSSVTKPTKPNYELRHLAKH